MYSMGCRHRVKGSECSSSQHRKTSLAKRRSIVGHIGSPVDCPLVADHCFMQTAWGARPHAPAMGSTRPASACSMQCLSRNVPIPFP